MTAFAGWALAASLGFAVTVLIGLPLVPRLQMMQFGRVQPLFAKGDAAPEKVALGGLLPVIGCCSALLVTCLTDRLRGGDLLAAGSLVPQELYSKLAGGVLLALMFALIGGMEDGTRLLKGPAAGLTLRQRTALQLFAALAYCTTLYMAMRGAPYFYLPFFGMLEIGFFHWILGLLLLYGTANAMRYAPTDGSLCSVTAVIAAVTVAVIAGRKGFSGYAACAAALGGAALGAALWSPRMRLGETGALFYGGMLAGLAYATHCPLLLPLIGLAYTADGAAKVIQTVHYRLTGRRLLKEAPLHAHLAACGLSARRVTAVFVLLQAAGGIAACLILYFSGYYR
ncbi:MAG: hypothetical protein IJK64_06280 [Clostridia bacterium]|nr:hypothetical protein [Clostridia bacterium]